MSLAPILTTIATGEGERKIARIKGRFANFGPVMQGPVRKLFLVAMRKQFSSRGQYGGTPWPRLTKQTLDRKRRWGLRLSPLRATDRLYKSLTVRGGPEQQTIITRNSFKFRTLVPYAPVHQTGDDHTPQRVIIPDPMPAEFMVQLRNIVTGYLVEGQLG